MMKIHSEDGSTTLDEESDNEDPRYRRMRPSHFPPYEKDTSQEDLMKKYLPHVRVICWAGLLVTILFACDYFITPNSFQENVEGVLRVSRGNTRHFYWVTTNNGKIKVYDDQAISLRKESMIRVKKSRIFKTVMAVETINGTSRISLGYVYKTLLFFPVVLFITSMLGLLKWRGFEFPFNLSIVTAILLVIDLVLII